MHPAREIPVLQIENLSKSFGGVAANVGVSMTVRDGEVHGLIGPNGAGKTTLVSLLAGEVRPDHGRILLDGVDVTDLRTPRRAQLGIRRSYQITSIFPELTVLENAVLACQALRGGSFRLWTPIRSDRDLREAGRAALQLVGIEALADRPAGSLSHGERRHVELAMVLVGEPRILLLDEPFAGMGPEETVEMVGRLQQIKRKHAILLIEHDMDAVFSLADRLTVMVMGTPVATGSPELIRGDEAVQASTLR